MEIQSLGNAGNLAAIRQTEEESRSIIEAGEQLQKAEGGEKESQAPAVENLGNDGEDSKSFQQEALTLGKEEGKGGVLDILG
jgi:hypothetical protein